MLDYNKATKEIRLTRGDTAELDLNVKIKATGEPYDYSNDTTEFTVKANEHTEFVILKKIFSGHSIKINPEETINLPYKTFKYSVRIITPNNDKYTVIAHKDFTITEEENDNVSGT